MTSQNPARKGSARAVRSSTFVPVRAAKAKLASTISVATPMASATRPGSPGLHAFHEQGPFDEPPAEPVELDPEALPWELSDESNGDAPAATS